MIDVEKIKNQSTGRWRGILANLGIEVPEDPRRHVPCPSCGGRDRFRFDDKDGRGGYVCNQCGAGDGISLVQKVLGLNFLESCQRVAGVIGTSDFEQPKEKQVNHKNMLNDLWKSSKPLTGSDPASIYLHTRGVVLQPESVRYCAECYESETKAKMNAMVALVVGKDCKGITIHRTYIKDGKKAGIKSPKKLMPHDGNLRGSAIRLFKPKDVTLGVAEGIETACAATQLFDIPTWACVSSTILESFIPPDEIKRVIVFGDNDANFTGQKSAYKLANELYVKHDKIVDVQIPEIPGSDWADILIKQVEKQRQAG